LLAWSIWVWQPALKYQYLTELRKGIEQALFWQQLIPKENPFFELFKDNKPTHKPCFDPDFGYLSIDKVSLKK